MKQITVLSFTLFILLSASCRKEDKFLVIDAGKIITSENKEIEGIESLTKDITVIPLETNENSFLGELLTKITLSDGDIIITDYERKILKFDLQGNYTGHIGRIGNGPGELPYILSHAVNRDNNEVSLLGIAQINIYSSDGEFKYNLHPESRFQVFTVSNNNFYFMNHSQYEDGIDIIEIRNPKNEFVKGIRNRTPGHIGPAIFPELTSDKNGVYYKEEFSDTLYRIDPVSYEVKPIGLINFGKNTLTRDMLYMDFMDKWSDLYRVEKFWAANNYILLSLQKGLIDIEYRSFVYSIKKDKFYELKIGNIPVKLMDYYDGTIVAFAESITVLNNLDSIDNSKLREKLSGITEDSNPVIFKIRLQ